MANNNSIDPLENVCSCKIELYSGNNKKKIKQKNMKVEEIHILFTTCS